MTTNLKNILSQIHKICSDLVDSVCGAAAGTSSFEMEALIFERVHALGLELMSAYFAVQAPHYRWSSATDTDGHVLHYNCERGAQFYSIFGEVPLTRSYYCGDGRGWFPMDAALNLPPKGASDFQRKMVEELSLSMSFVDTTAFLARYFPLATSTRAVQEVVYTDSLDAGAYYAQAPAPTPSQRASILVVQGDGKGVPMVKQTLAVEIEPGKPKEPPKREGKKKEATVVSVSTHSPFIRTPEQVVASLFDGKVINSDSQQTVASKRVWATMEGKQPALAQARTWVGQFEGDHIRERVTLSDGLPSLQRALDEAFPEHVRVLDLMHALGYLWKAADVWFGKSKHGRAWVRDSVLILLQGKAADIVEEVDRWGRETSSAGKLILENAANYLRNNLDAMAYNVYLGKGWPIATGMIEGACRHIVKDRCERSGMRWTGDGVEAILRLRCLHANGDWEAYHRFRMASRHHILYGAPAPKLMNTQDTNVHEFNATQQFAKAA